MFIFLKWFEPLRSFNFDAIYWSCKTAKNPRDVRDIILANKINNKNEHFNLENLIISTFDCQKLDLPSQHLLTTYDERGGPESTGQGKSRIPTF